MARLFSLKPLVLALIMGFGATAVRAEDASVPQAEDYTPAHTATSKPAKTSQSEADPLSLGSTCLFCDHEDAKPAETAEIKRSGEPALPADYTRVNANKIEGQTQVGVRAEGDVIVERNADVLNADWAQYDQAADTVTAGDRFTLYQNGSTVSGDQLVYNLKDQTGSGTAVRLNTEQGGRAFKVSAKKPNSKEKASTNSSIPNSTPVRPAMPAGISKRKALKPMNRQASA